METTPFERRGKPLLCERILPNPQTRTAFPRGHPPVPSRREHRPDVLVEHDGGSFSVRKATIAEGIRGEFLKASKRRAETPKMAARRCEFAIVP
jgi:hypothetical protein